MKKIRVIAVAVLAVGAVLFAGPASAAECGTPAVAAVYDTVEVPGTDAVYGPDVKVIDVAAQAAVEEVSHIEHRLVSPAVEAVPSKWWNWSPNKDQGPFDGPPSFPSDERGTWQGPHTEGGPGQDEVGTFQQGNGHGSWFHREAAIPGKDAVYEDVKVIDVEAKPAVEEVSHMEKGPLLQPATEATTKQVLVSEAVPAGEPCVTDKPTKDKPTVVVDTPSNPTPPTTQAAPVLAYTGPNTALASLAAALLVLGAGAHFARRRFA